MAREQVEDIIAREGVFRVPKNAGCFVAGCSDRRFARPESVVAGGVAVLFTQALEEILEILQNGG